MSDNKNIVLVVDLDGTLIRTDSIVETILIAVRKSPFVLFLLPFWIFKGKNFFKNKIIRYGLPDVTLFPYNDHVMNIIKEARNKGRRTVLSSASKEGIVRSVQEHLQLFDEIIFSTDDYNNRAENKVKILIDKYGQNGFDYIGNGYSDLPVFSKSNKAILVSDNKHLIGMAGIACKNLETVNAERNNFRNIIKGMRIYQWIKNILIFLPLLLAHEYSNKNLIILTIVGFFCLSLSASFIYLVNDLLDLESDRKHKFKCKRPFASGILSPLFAMSISFPLVVCSLIVAFIFLPFEFGLILTVYLFLSTIYSFLLKKIPLVDIITLSLLFTIRILAGSMIGFIELSNWFIAFSLFLFFSLAIVKRYAELSNLLKRNETKTSGRGYRTSDMKILMLMGVSSGFVSVLIFLFYLFSPQIERLYHHPLYLLPVCVILLIWISRMWLLARGGVMNEDPIVFTSKDKYSYLMMFFVVILIYFAI